MVNKIMMPYWGAMRKDLKAHPELEKTVPAFLINPEKLTFYVGKTHLGVEYYGPTSKDAINDDGRVEVEVFDYRDTENLLDEILGIDFNDSTAKGPRFPLPEVTHNLYCPTNRAHDAMLTNGWNFAAQDMMMMINSPGFALEANRFARIIDSYFYDADNGRLKVRHVKWLDLFPCQHQLDVDVDHDRMDIWFFPEPDKQAQIDNRVTLRRPPDYQMDKLRQLNRFVEMAFSIDVSEPEITSFLAAKENQFIIKLAFFATAIYPEKECQWAETGKKAIKPDFFAEHPNGFSDIVEFKLPDFGGSVTTGTENRKAFSAKVTAYAAQTRVYEEYFEDPRNKRHVAEQHGIKVQYPHRFLVVGRRWMFSTGDWKKIQNDFRNLTIVTYDDLVDGVRGQLYA
jgi:hypothetical protein